MPTKMETIAHDIALAVLRLVIPQEAPARRLTAATTAFRLDWPPTTSTEPMRDALEAAIRAGELHTGQEAAEWTTRLQQAWTLAVDQTEKAYIDSARRSFRTGNHLQAAETLTDAVRTILGCIAASRAWPHETDEDLYTIAAMLGSGRPWPHSLEELHQALINRSHEAERFDEALHICMVLPKRIAMDYYHDAPESAATDGLAAIETFLQISHSLAGRTPAPIISTAPPTAPTTT